MTIGRLFSFILIAILFIGCASGVSSYKKPKKKKKKCDCPSWSYSPKESDENTFEKSLASTAFKPYFCNLESI